MKLSGQSQAELIKLAAIAVGAGALAWAGVKLYRGAANGLTSMVDGIKASVTGAVDAVIAAPGKAFEAAKETARTGGQTWLDGYTPQTAPDSGPPGAPPVPASPYGGVYSNPMVNNDGMDFNLF